MSLMRWPPWEFSIQPCRSELITDFESPLVTDLLKPVSRVIFTARLATSSSRI